MAEILVVDDAPDIRMLVGHVLATKGHVVSEASGGLAALERLQAGDARPDLVILDVQMADLDGWETLTRIRRDDRLAGLPVILCTVRNSMQNSENVTALMANGYVDKPFDVADLLAEVERVLSAPGETPAGPLPIKE